MSIQSTTIRTYSGKYFDFAAPSPFVIEIEDIARGLSNMCRFAGQCPRFYSVAEHSVHASYLVQPELAWDALMHDAAEAFILDMPKPLKEMLPDYQKIERKVEEVIALKFGLHLPMSAEIKAVDKALLRAERIALFPQSASDTWKHDIDAETVSVDFVFAAPEEAFKMFMWRANDIIHPLTPSEYAATRRMSMASK